MELYTEANIKRIDNTSKSKNTSRIWSWAAYCFPFVLRKQKGLNTIVSA